MHQCQVKRSIQEKRKGKRKLQIKGKGNGSALESKEIRVQYKMI